jgi:hypothetical protein
MISLGQLGPCSKCDNLLEFSGTNRNPAHMAEIGQLVHYSKRLETGTATTISRFFQCPDCGQLWQEVEDAGPEGQSKRLYFLELF